MTTTSPDVIAQHYHVDKAFKTKMDRVLPERLSYNIPMADFTNVDEILNSD